MDRAAHLDWAYTTAIGGIALLLVTSTLFIALTRRLRQPPVIGEIIAGICLGPSALGLLPGNLTDRLFPDEVRPLLTIVAHAGVLLFMFIVGWELDGRVLRGRRRPLGLLWLGGVALPMGLGIGLAAVLYDLHDTVDGRPIRFLPFALFLGVAMSIAAFPVLARLLTEHGIHRLPLGSYALAVAALDDIFAWSMLAFVSALATSAGTAEPVKIAIWGAVYVAALLWLVRPLLAWLVNRLSSTAFAQLPLLIAAGTLGSAYVSSAIGLHMIFGAFLFGAIMPKDGDRDLLRRTVVIPLEDAGRLLLPVFFVVTGLSVDLTSITAAGLLQLALIIVVACGGKLGGITLSARLTGLGWRDSTALGILLNTRGLTELVILNVGYSLGLLSTELFTLMVIMALLTTGMTSPLIGAVLRRARRDGGVPGLDLLGATTRASPAAASVSAHDRDP
ncbi:cation/H(+) antiporter [Actinomadura soli]|uniref:Cation/H(+) antiporter n=1 Tax=Actinomadura soli TaxID=2508997 RepID=A0A5C4JET8_9ACTN|nr:cation:proton antiporter [Actinomadura soli]TMR02592.1 cation/H(+) antiporter [Actinomadura soli]